MIIGIYGPHATGKTTFLRQHLDDFADAHPNGLRVVCADNPYEWHLTSDGASWLFYQRHDWKNDKATKIPLLKSCMMDGNVWIIESARVFSGYGLELAEFVKQGGRIKFIIPTVTGDLLKAFIQNRCLVNGEKFNFAYWDEQRLNYESCDRYVNFVNKHMQPIGVDNFAIDIDSERKAWGRVFDKIVEWLQCL